MGAIEVHSRYQAIRTLLEHAIYVAQALHGSQGQKSNATFVPSSFTFRSLEFNWVPPDTSIRVQSLTKLVQNTMDIVTYTFLKMLGQNNRVQPVYIGLVEICTKFRQTKKTTEILQHKYRVLLNFEHDWFATFRNLKIRYLSASVDSSSYELILSRNNIRVAGILPWLYFSQKLGSQEALTFNMQIIRNWHQKDFTK